MKFSTLTKVFTVGAIALSSLTHIRQPSFAGTPPAEGTTGFWCDTTGDYPLTRYQNSAGEQEAWIGWTSTAFSGAGYNPISRCEQVTRRFEQYRSTGKLALITTDKINGQQVICAGELPGRCIGLLYTLKPGESPYEAMSAIRALAEGKAGTPIRYESEDDSQESAIPFVDVRALLGQNSNSSVTPGRNVQLQPLPSTTNTITPGRNVQPQQRKRNPARL